ncbi:alpha-L-fucosidase [Maribacter sp. 4U21]|uniref:glycoside hydrolase family 95 protein n=1 Tax=Maribacter sp. 4U21 TaxID=1889779 RepID=UPI000C14CDD7|nr:glycoside hydrolase family 95 protein [Maribacter sp. 4U21]PIB29509.1 alpha-L-fucosidase [Maribacter sp. 4U21]
MKNVIYIGALALCFLSCKTETEHFTKFQSNVLYYNEPAEEWVAAIPIGNGRLGAMIHGAPSTEHIQLNESTVWAGGPHNNSNPKIKDSLDHVRKLIFEDKYMEAEAIALRTIISESGHGMPYQTVGDFFMDFEGHDNYSEYQRSLSLDSAFTRTSYKIGNTHYKREAFSSLADEVIVMKIMASQPNSLSFKSRITRPERVNITTANGNLLKMSGTTADHEGINGEVKFETLVKIIPKGGIVTTTDSIITVTDADEALVYISIGTNFKNYDDISGDAFKVANAKLQTAVKKDYNELRTAHIEKYKNFFDRVQINLGETDSIHKPTDLRIREFSQGNDPNLVALYFQFGRYLLISSSQPGGQPANLQGLWNNQLYPPWDSKYTININTEMNYWPAEITNLTEMHEPLLRMVKELSETGRESAEIMYGANGWVAHHNTDIWRFTGAIDARAGTWPCGGAWLAQHLWEKYIFSGDTDYLQSVYPILKEGSRFYLDFLVEEPTNNWLVVSPSISPENAPQMVREEKNLLVAGATMDNQLVFDLFTKTMKASEILHKDNTLKDSIQAALAKLLPMQIGRLGQLQEWLEDWDSAEDHHRHISHLYGLHPSNQISPYRTPELFNAVKTSMFYRGDPATGWSMNWKINMWARLLDGNHALKLMAEQISLVEDMDYENLNVRGKAGTYPNMFDAHPPFQIDGNFGFTSGITEMLIQSHDGAIHILPALPDPWNTGQINGIRARGGFEIKKLSWAQNKVSQLIIKSTIGGNCRIRSYWPLKSKKELVLVENEMENTNPYYHTPEIKKPIIKGTSTLTSTTLKKVFEYDIKTKPGEIMELEIKAH